MEFIPEFSGPSGAGVLIYGFPLVWVDGCSWACSFSSSSKDAGRAGYGGWRKSSGKVVPGNGEGLQVTGRTPTASTPGIAPFYR